MLVSWNGGRQKILPEKVARGEGVLTVVMVSERLRDDWNAIGVRHECQMGCRN